MKELERFKIVYSQEVLDFLNRLDSKVRAKIMYNVSRSKYVIDPELFKKLGDTDIWEFRTLYNGIQYRIFAFWDSDGDALVVTTHAIVKKTQKTPSREIRRAEEIRRIYFRQKGLWKR